jgi:phosphoglycerate dehydrogenase-like enzyme
VPHLVVAILSYLRYTDEMAKILLNTPQNSLWKELTDFLKKTVDAEVQTSADLAELPPQDLATVNALVTYGLKESFVPSLSSMRLVAIPMAGTNSLPLKALRDAGVMVINAHANGRWVAERALGLLLAAAGKIVTGDRDLRNGQWHGFAAGEPVELSWRPVSEMTVAIIGTGSIGQRTAALLRPFGCRIIGVRRQSGMEGIPDGLFDEVVTNPSVAFSRADAVIVTLPSTPETAGMIGKDLLSMLDGGILVNVGRGDVIDEGALYRSCASGALTAAIDTWFSYPDPPGSRCMPSRFPLERLDNVILSPHLGGFTPPATAASAREVVDRVIGWVRQGMPDSLENTVDLEAGY